MSKYPQRKQPPMATGVPIHLSTPSTFPKVTMKLCLFPSSCLLGLLLARAEASTLLPNFPQDKELRSCVAFRADDDRSLLNHPSPAGWSSCYMQWWKATPASSKDAPDEQALTVHPLDSHSKDKVDPLPPLGQRRNRAAVSFPSHLIPDFQEVILPTSLNKGSHSDFPAELPPRAAHEGFQSMPPLHVY